ncbi:Cadherin domain protein [Caulifigura coniformis]|uniref:Cadherin domain protein n=1 Tax=Caulifigura coniformis TaxID=2527983 RepID=A0A517SDP0_9PLAN|nr:cadherin repeat domain-containing protein [Caulifigura coniformis]QDT54231.1 Cadherin domain protein [Caulifigura coniformis]
MGFSSWGRLLGGLRHSMNLGGTPRRRRVGSSITTEPLALETRLLPAATPIGAPVLVDAPADGDVNTVERDNQSIAADAAGNFVVTWHQETSDGINVMARRFHADGTPAGEAFVVNTSSVSDQRLPAVAMNASGSFVIVWESGDDGPRRDIFARRYDADGTALGSEFRVHADVDDLRLNPEVALSEDGSFAITWARHDLPSSNIDLFVRRYDSTGVPLGNELEVVSDVNQQSPEIASTPDGGYILVWADLFQLHGQRFDADGEEIGGRFAIGTTNFAESPAIAVDTDGGFLVAWQGTTEFTFDYKHIYAQRFTAEGVADGDQFLVNSNPTVNREWAPAVAVTVDGNFVISWTGENPHFSYRDVFARTFNADGVPLEDAFRVNPASAGDQRFGYVAMTPTGDFVVNWADGAEGDLYVQRYVLNFAPSDIVLSSNSIPENSPAGSVVGALSATDLGLGDTFVFELVSGDGDTGNGAFEIVGSELRTTASFDYESQSNYSIRVRATDLAGATVEKVLTVDVANVAETPEITLSNNSVDENLPRKTVVGVLGLTDAPDGPLKFRLVRGEGASGNGRFRISGNQLVTKSRLDAEQQSSYTVRIQVTDAQGNVTVQVFEIEVGDVNEPVTRLKFERASFAENMPAGTVAGTLQAIDPDADDSWTYELVSGTGDGDNDLFTIVGDEIQTAAELDYETKSHYSVRVRVTDSEGESVEKRLTIRIANVNEQPTAIALSNSTAGVNQKAGTVIGQLSVLDPDRNERFQFSLVPGAADNSLFQVQGRNLKTNVMFDAPAIFPVRLRVTDKDGLWFEDDFSITVE